MNDTWLRYLPAFLRARLEGRHNLQKIIGNIGWLFIDKILRMGVGLLVLVWLARYLGPTQFGIYNYAIAFVALFSAIATLGLDRIVVRDIVRDPDSANEILGTAFVLKLVGGVLTLVLTVGVISMMHPDDNLTRWLVGIIAAGTVFQAFDAIDFWFQSQVRSKYTVYAKNAAFLLASIGKIGLILIGAPLIAFAWIGLAEVAIGAVGLVVVYRASGHMLRQWRGTLARGKGLLKDGWPLILSMLAIYIQARIDQVMLGEMIGAGEVGQYSVAMRLIEVFGFIPMIICTSIAPAVTEAKIQGEASYYERLVNLYRLMFALFLIIAVPIILFATQIMVMLFGEEYKAAGVLLALFSVRLFFTNFGVAKSLFITNENLFKYSLITAIVGALINIALNYVLIPKYASIGAIWATIASFSVTIFVIDLFYSRTRPNLKIMLKAVVTPWQLKIK